MTISPVHRTDAHSGLVGVCAVSPVRRQPPAAAIWYLSGRPTPDATLQEVPIPASRFTIGRRSEHSLCLANPTVSGNHAELSMVADKLYVRDLDSTNGTYLNGHRIEHLQQLAHGDMLQFGTARFHVHRSAERDTCITQKTDVADDALAYLQFDNLLNDPAVVPYFQPIVRLTDAHRVGYEVLARSRLVGLQTPDVMFHVASLLNSESELSRLMRREGVRVGSTLTASTPLQLYLNTHPAELRDPGLLPSLQAVRDEFPDVSIILEIHEAAVTSVPELAILRTGLTELGIGLAYDDFGAGQARLLELADVPPDVIKFDIHLIRGLPGASAERRRMVLTLVQIVKDLDVIPLAEGIETAEEAEICYRLGFELAQGFYFGEPSPASVWLRPGGPDAAPRQS